jgi:catechol 2,3-dioxygenase-like lactoylglutathione lyase family enzyme
MGSIPRIERLHHWTLISRDVERAKRFYVDILGAEDCRPSEGPTSVNLAGTVIDIFPANDPFPGQPAPGTGAQHHAYLVALDDYERWIEHFKSNGVRFTPRAHGVTRLSIYVDDLDGYHIELTVLFDDGDVGRREIEKRGLLPRPGERPAWLGG